MCSAARVREEMAGYSDFALHRFALQHPKRFGEYALDAGHVMDSGKCRTLAQLLPRLKARSLLYRCPSSSQSDPQLPVLLEIKFYIAISFGSHWCCP